MAHTNKLIVVLTPVADREQGDYHYRVRQPFQALTRAAPDFQVAVISNVLPNKEMLLLAADLVIIRMVADADLIGLAWERKQAQRPTVFEIADDFLSLPECNPAAEYYAREETRAILFQLIAQCDMVQVTTAALQRKYSRYHTQIEVFENHVEKLLPLTPKSPQTTLAWAGSDGHFDDMKAVADVLVQWLRRHSQVRLALKCSPRIHDLFVDLPAEQVVFEEPGSLPSYMEFLSHFHIGIAPLIDNEYNRARSDIKFLEYSSAGLAAVCADLETYNTSLAHGTNGLLFDSPDALIDSLDEVLLRESWREQLVEQARSYVHRERLEANHVTRRVASYLQLMGDDTRGRSKVNLDRWHVEETAPGFFEEKEAPETTALLSGMGKGDPEAPLPHFAEAIEINPKYDRPFLCAGVALSSRDPERALRYLRHSLDLNPSAVYARLLMGDVLARAGRVADAAEEYATAWRQCPAYVDPLVRLARLCSEAGEEERADRHLRIAAEICPHHPALQGLSTGNGQHSEEDDAV
jgi:tetratricopeptide (TPR) repeat protein